MKTSTKFTVTGYVDGNKETLVWKDSLSYFEDNDSYKRLESLIWSVEDNASLNSMLGMDASSSDISGAFNLCRILFDKDPEPVFEWDGEPLSNHYDNGIS